MSVTVLLTKNTKFRRMCPWKVYGSLRHKYALLRENSIRKNTYLVDSF